MQEFSSVTASSYDAESLAPLLNEKAADGWSVVSIVAAGTNIVAYLQREADSAPPAADETLATEAPVIEEATADDPFIAVDDTQAATEEPAGWATAPEESDEASVAALAAQVTEPEPGPTAAPEPVAEPEPEPVAEAAPAVESAVPAGWYADPSGRFELRYWDGNAWTEHVSRAGQQFTDPPVA